MSLELRPSDLPELPRGAPRRAEPAWEGVLGLSQGAIRRKVSRDAASTPAYPVVLQQGVDRRLPLLHARGTGRASPASASSAPTSRQYKDGLARRPYPRPRRPKIQPASAHSACLQDPEAGEDINRPGGGSSTPMTGTCAGPPREPGGSRWTLWGARGASSAAGPPQGGRQHCGLTPEFRHTGGRRGGAARQGTARCLRGDERAHRRDPRDGFRTRTFEPVVLHAAPHQGPVRHVSATNLGDPLGRPRPTRGGYPDRVRRSRPDHPRPARARGPPDLAEHDLRRHRFSPRHRRDHPPQRGGGPPTARWT